MDTYEIGDRAWFSDEFEVRLLFSATSYSIKYVEFQCATNSQNGGAQGILDGAPRFPGRPPRDLLGNAPASRPISWDGRRVSREIVKFTG